MTHYHARCRGPAPTADTLACIRLPMYMLLLASDWPCGRRGPQRMGSSTACACTLCVRAHCACALCARRCKWRTRRMTKKTAHRNMGHKAHAWWASKPARLFNWCMVRTKLHGVHARASSKQISCRGCVCPVGHASPALHGSSIYMRAGAPGRTQGAQGQKWACRYPNPMASGDLCLTLLFGPHVQAECAPRAWVRTCLLHGLAITAQGSPRQAPGPCSTRNEDMFSRGRKVCLHSLRP